jgi:hypothetical protein
MQSKYYILFLAMLSLFLFILIFKWIHYLALNHYISENFDNNTQIVKDTGNPQTSHTLDLPLTTTYSCKNICGPTSTCSLTGQQCFTDIDCPGCQPYVPPLPASKISIVPGDNDAGKLTTGNTPTYSTLTTDIGTQAKTLNDYMSKSPIADFGINTWRTTFNQSRQLFDERYKPSGLQYMPQYEKRFSVTGEFIDEGPLPSNANLPNA